MITGILPHRRKAFRGSGGPTLIAQDNFDLYANDYVLDTASNWALIQGTVSVSNVSGTAGSVYGTSSGIATRITETFSADQRAEAMLEGTGSSFNFALISVRGESAAATAYALHVDGDIYYLMDFIAGAQTVVTNNTLALVAGNRFALEISGAGSAARMKIQKDVGAGWVDVATGIDPGAAHYIDGGKPGVGGSGNITSLRCADWKGYSL